LNQNIKKMIKGKNIIGVGARRVVYDLGNGFVLKVVKSKFGIKNNKREVMIYRSSLLEIRKHLGQIKKYGDGYSWLVMKKYSRDLPKSIKYSRKLYKIKAKFIKNGIVPYEASGRYGPNYNNIRLKTNGEIVVIDYGNFKYRR
jgi:hypothetical protein